MKPALNIVETPFELETPEHKRLTVAREVDKFFSEEQITTADALLSKAEWELGYELSIAPKED